MYNKNGKICSGMSLPLSLSFSLQKWNIIDSHYAFLKALGEIKRRKEEEFKEVLVF